MAVSGFVVALGVWFCGAGPALSAPNVPVNVIWQTGVEYSNPDEQHLQLNLARPKLGDGPFPAVLCIHGGGFRAGTREGYDRLCIQLAERGYVAATITYRLSPKFKFPAAVHDTKAAVRWLRPLSALKCGDGKVNFGINFSWRIRPLGAAARRKPRPESTG